MSTDHVLKDSLAIAENEGLKVALLPEWYDVDETADLTRLTQAANLPLHTQSYLATIPDQPM
jgi:glycosyltransferase A (GT-A) superfamily protein (DUF2064 family)